MLARDKLHQQSEYIRLTEGSKPMVAYYKAVGEPYFYQDRAQFIADAKSGILTCKRFYVKNEKQNFRLSYETFSLPTEAWRLDLYAQIKLVGQKLWTPDLEAIESIVLGYREELVGARRKEQFR